MSTCNTLNLIQASIAWNYPTLCSKIMVFLNVRQDFTYIKPDLKQSDSDTSQAMWNKTQTTPDITIRRVQNLLSILQLLYEYRLPEEVGILNSC